MNQIARFLVVPAPVVLVVEDEFALCDVIADELEAAGYVVITAATGEEAVGILDRQPIDLLLTDIRLPGIVDGWRVAEAARARRSDLPIVYMSGYAVAQPRHASRSRFLCKPFRPAEVIEAVEALGVSRRHRQPST